MTATQNRPFRVDVVRPNVKRISYRFAVANGRASRFLKERHPISLVTSPVEADLIDGGVMTTYGVTLAELGLIPEPAPEFLAVHVPAPSAEEELVGELPAVPVEQPAPEPTPGEETMLLTAEPPTAPVVEDERYVEDCIDPEVLAKLDEPVPTPPNGWNKTRLRKLRADDLHRLGRDLGVTIDPDASKSEAFAIVADALKL